MAEITITTDEEETTEQQSIHNDTGHCEHCVQHAERLVSLENRIVALEGELMTARADATIALEQSEQASQTAEAAAVVALEVAIEQEESIDESELSGTGELEVGGPPGLPDEQPGYNAAESEPITIQVEPEKEPEEKQPTYGFRRGKRR